MGVLCALVMASCVRVLPPAPVSSPPQRPELWVDAFAAEGGDGGRAAALKQVPSLTQPTSVHLRSGLYRGPFIFPGGTRLEGHGEVVLFDEGNGTVVSTPGPLALVRVSVQGGRLGISATGALSLEHVKFSGHRSAGLQLVDGGLTGHHLEVGSRVDGVVGVDATNSSVTLHDVKLSGPLLVGVRAKDSAVTLTTVSSEGPATAVQTLGGSLALKGLRAAGGMRTAVSVSKTKATLGGLDVTGHEYAVLGVGSDVDLDGLTSGGAFGGGVSLLNSTLRLTNATVQRAGPLGGVQLLGCTSVLGAVTVTDSQAWGVMVRQGTASIGALTATGLRGGGGDALHVRDAKVSIERLEASGLEGSGIYASNYATVTAGSVEVSGAETSAIVVERKSTVSATRVSSRGGRGPALAVPEDGLLTVDTLTAQGGDVAVWADCATESFVTVKAVTAGTELPRLRCLQGPLGPGR
ncbi:MAG: hypothetical protein Q8N26_07185 [Myxococcales bacterium]|nr:hypothetical protein [Myxococcales bacterium]